jgi:hypothetical protein
MSRDSIIFNETVVTAEADPGEDEYTVLMFGTADWQMNKQNFVEKHGSKS